MKRLFFRVIQKLGITKRLSLRIRSHKNGHPMTIPVLNGIGLGNYLNLSEPWMEDVLKGLCSLNEEGVFVDVGVNVGQTLIKLKSIDPTIHYVGFEPNPVCVNYLNALIAENSFENIDLFPVGISETSGIMQLRFFNDSSTDSSASIIENYREESKVIRTVNVPVFKYEDLPSASEQRIRMLKVDVEGAELEVLSSLEEKIKSDQPIVLFEVLPAYSTEQSNRIERQDGIYSLLQGLDYSIMRVIKPNNKLKGLEPIDTFGIHSNLNECEYVAVPKKREQEIRDLLSSTSSH